MYDLKTGGVVTFNFLEWLDGNSVRQVEYVNHMVYLFLFGLALSKFDKRFRNSPLSPLFALLHSASPLLSPSVKFSSSIVV